jgi:FKBP-type peptidyl-prolyl cis-trans isomerase SlyD
MLLSFKHEGDVMTIKKGKVVTLSYLLVNEAGEELDRSEPGEPLIYLHGTGQIVPGLENQLEGLKAGEKRAKIKVLPADAYGEMRPDLKLTVGRKQFPQDAELEPGMRFWAHTPEGEKHPFTIVKVAGDKVDIDGNHPLAGETLFFDVEVQGIREATKEELEHGHAHGPGGHTH